FLNKRKDFISLPFNFINTECSKNVIITFNMNFQFKEIKIGRLIKEIIDKKEIEENRVTSYLKISERELLKLFESDSIDTDLLLRCCKLLEYDFFRIYSQHLLLYSPFTIHTKEKTVKKGIVSTPVFRKNL